ncbi:MAG: DUF4115 domain-containing protein [Chromatiales bacterium]|nr:DUF4115 domain-containing protein [Chromatiales bacterium]
MSQESEVAVEESAADANGGPGQLLRETREVLNLTPQQAANQLRMQVRIIEALESDDYSALPGLTFVQGYLRSYARVLGIAEERVLALLPSSMTRGEPELVKSILDGDIEASSSDLPFRLITITVIVLGLAGIGWWFSQQKPSPEVFASASSPVDGQTELAMPARADNEGEVGLALPVVEESPLPEGEESESGMDSESSETAAEGAGLVAVQDESEVVPPLQDGMSSAGGREDYGAEPQSALATETTEGAISDIAPLTARTPQSKLELEFQADSWSEIVDTAGRQLTYGLIPAGSKLTVRGEAPFRVFFGYASGVLVYYNGHLFEHAPYQRGDVARFRIGRAEHNQPLSGN